MTPEQAFMLELTERFEAAVQDLGHVANRIESAAQRNSEAASTMSRAASSMNDAAGSMSMAGRRF